MASMLSIFFDIIRLRRGPQDLPYAPSLPLFLAAACVATQTVTRSIPTAAPYAESFAAAGIDIVLVLVALRIALRVRGIGNRFAQSASALLGCNLLFTLVNLPVLVAFGKVPIESGRIVPEQVTDLQMLLSPLIVALGIWQLIVNAHVLRHSLNLSFLGGIAVIVGWIALLALLFALAAAPTGA